MSNMESKSSKQYVAHEDLPWQECDMLDGPDNLVTCTLHLMEKMFAISDITHERHIEYPAWKCNCNEHSEMKKIEQETTNKATEVSDANDSQKDGANNHSSHQLDLIDSFPSSPTESNSTTSSNTDKHAWLNWTFCYDDECTIHMSEKQGSGYWPREKKKKRRNNKKRI